MRDVRMAARLARGAVVAAVLLPLVACASDGPSTSKALFRAPTYSGTGGGWYAADAAQSYNETGLAGWYREPKAKTKLSRWISAKFTRRGKTEKAPTLAAVTGSGRLPVPSVIEVTNLATGKTVRVRVEQRAQMKGRILSLSEAAARQLGGDLTTPMHIRARYVAPMVVMQEAPTLRYARAKPKPLPKAVPAPQPVEVAALAPKPVPAPAAVPAAAPPAPAAAPAVATAGRPAAAVAATSRAPSSVYRIQAGAFASRDNAERARTKLSAAGPASIEPLQRDGVTLFRVVVRGSADEAQAKKLQSRVNALGFADARLVRPS